MRSTTFLVLICVLIFCAARPKKKVSPEIMDIFSSKISQYNEKCSQQAQITQDFAIGHITNALIPYDSNLLKYIECIYENLGFYTEKGDFKRDLIIHTFSYMNPSLTNKCINKARVQEERLNKTFLFAACVADELGT